MPAERLSFLQRKYLLRLEWADIPETTRYFGSARRIFEALQRKGLAVRVQDEDGEWWWEITKAGRARIGGSNAG